jgi:hypothetical protein
MPPLTRVIQVAEPMRHGRAAAPLDRSVSSRTRRSMPNLNPTPPVDAPGQAHVCPVDPLAGVIQMAEPTLGWDPGTRRSLPSAGPLPLVAAPGQARLCPLDALAKAIQVAVPTPGWSPRTQRSLPSADPLRLVAALGQAHLCPLDALAKVIQVEEPTPGWGPRPRRSLSNAGPARLVAPRGQAHLCPVDALAKLVQVAEPTPGWGPRPRRSLSSAGPVRLVVARGGSASPTSLAEVVHGAEPMGPRSRMAAPLNHLLTTHCPSCRRWSRPARSLAGAAADSHHDMQPAPKSLRNRKSGAVPAARRPDVEASSGGGERCPAVAAGWSILRRRAAIPATTGANAAGGFRHVVCAWARMTLLLRAATVVIVPARLAAAGRRPAPRPPAREGVGEGAAGRAARRRAHPSGALTIGYMLQVNRGEQPLSGC